MTTTNQMNIHLEPTIDIDAWGDPDGTFYIVVTDKNLELVLMFDMVDHNRMAASDWADRAGLLKIDALEAAITDLKAALKETAGEGEL